MRGAGYYVPKTATTKISNIARIGFNKTIGRLTGIHLDRDKILDRVAHPSEIRLGTRPSKKSKSKSKSKRGGRKPRQSIGSKTRRVH